MAATDHLGPQFGYHGTPAVLNPGDLVHPASAIGVESSAPSVGNRADHAYFATTRRQASYYAKPRLDALDAIGRQLDGEPASSIWQGHVYRVEPTGPTTPDAHEPDSYSSPSPLRVTGREWSRFDSSGQHSHEPNLGVQW